jgi:DNA-binding response OmpR family regulator
MVMNLDTRQVTKNGVLLPLRYKEFELLSLLVVNAGQVVTRAEIFDQVWGTDWLGDMRTLDVHIRWLREKLEDDPSNPELIQTVRGVGYRFALA